MISRKLMINVHLIIAAVFLPLLLLMPLTGTLYLWGFKGDQETKEAFKITGAVPTEEEAQEEFFRKEFAKQHLNYKFEYIRETKTDYVFRPTTRTYYVAIKTADGLTVSEVTPSIQKRLIELHKGHGPVMFRWFESIFGISLILVTLSGLWLAITVPVYRKITFVSFGIGATIILICLL